MVHKWSILKYISKNVILTIIGYNLENEFQVT